MTRLAIRVGALAQPAAQALSSLTNLLLTVVITRTGSIEGLGAFNLAFTAYIAGLGLFRAIVVEPLLASGKPDGLAGGQQACLLIGSIAGTAMVATGSALGDPILIQVGIGLPLLLFVDLLRFWFFRENAAIRSLGMDAVWLCVLVSTLLMPLDDVQQVVWLWIGGAGCAVVVGLTQKGLTKWRKHDLTAFVAEARGISIFAAMESSLYQFLWQLPTALMLSAAPILAGEYRSAVTVMAPLGVLISSYTISTYASARKSSSSFKELEHRAVVIVSVCMLYALAIFIGRDTVSTYFFGVPDILTVPVLLLVVAQTTFLAFGSQFAVWLKVRRKASKILVARVISTLPLAAMMITGIVTGQLIIVIAAIGAGALVHSGIVTVFARRATDG